MSEQARKVQQFLSDRLSSLMTADNRVPATEVVKAQLESLLASLEVHDPQVEVTVKEDGVYACKFTPPMSPFMYTLPDVLPNRRLAARPSQFLYLPDNVEYPDPEVLLHGMPRAVLFTYVGSNYLNGVCNYLTPLKAVLLERYRKMRKPEELQSLIEQMPYHRRLADLDDDVLVLFQEKNEPGRYWLLWFDCDVSDCSIGWFETSDTLEQITTELGRWLTVLCVRDAASKGKERDSWEATSDWTWLPDALLKQGSLSFH